MKEQTRYSTGTHYVLGFLFTPDYERVLLIRKAKPEWQKGLLNGVGGKIELADHWPLLAMRREFNEETRINASFWLQFAVMQSEGWTVHCYVSHLRRELMTGYEGSEQEPVDLYEIAALNPSACVPNLMWLLPMAQAHLQRDQPTAYITFNE